jgi:hypothetical protein
MYTRATLLPAIRNFLDQEQWSETALAAIRAYMNQTPNPDVDSFEDFLDFYRMVTEELGPALELSVEEMAWLMNKKELTEDLKEIQNNQSLYDACDASISTDEMLSSTITNCTSSNCSADGFWNELGENYDYIEEDQSFRNHPKIQCIWNKFNNNDNNVLCNLLQNFFGNTLLDLHLEVSSFATEENAVTNWDSRKPKIITIIFNKEKIDNNCEIKIMKTLMHEVIHAELYRIVKDPSIDPEDFPLVYESFRAIKGWQHDVMSKWYRDDLVVGLKEIYGNSYSDEEYQALAWEGLDEYERHNLDGSIDLIPITAAWLGLTNEERAEIRDLQSQLNEDCEESCD